MFLAPMLTGRQESPFVDDRYIVEPKLDGQRLILSMEHGHLRIYSAHGFDLTSQYPEFHWLPVADNEDVVLDGIAIAVDPETGRGNPDWLAKRYRMSKQMDIKEASMRNPLHCFVIDILRYKGEDIRERPLAERKELLSEAMESNLRFSRIPYIDHPDRGLTDSLRGSSMEGLVAKDKRSAYRSGKNDSWLLIRNYRYFNARIAGYRKNQFGWLVESGEEWRSIVTDSVPAAYRQAFYGIAKLLVTGEDKDYVYVRPEIEACLRYAKQRPDGTPFQPEFVRFVV
ncbi:hypothetical protein [Cohnella sp. AR92]|uniref:ATP-dependent DNA ligase n=1 Tax=Cohnella sp. AR92 TaxID=648716 RepID=UPI001315327E|nr:hypothetical protein [Cohnella sp. AR92]